MFLSFIPDCLSVTCNFLLSFTTDFFIICLFQLLIFILLPFYPVLFPLNYFCSVVCCFLVFKLSSLLLFVYYFFLSICFASVYICLVDCPYVLVLWTSPWKCFLHVYLITLLLCRFCMKIILVFERKEQSIQIKRICPSQ